MPAYALVQLQMLHVIGTVDGESDVVCADPC